MKAEGWEPARVGFVAKEPATCSNFSSHNAAPPVFSLPSPHDGRLPAATLLSQTFPHSDPGTDVETAVVLREVGAHGQVPGGTHLGFRGSITGEGKEPQAWLCSMSCHVTWVGH